MNRIPLKAVFVVSVFFLAMTIVSPVNAQVPNLENHYTFDDPNDLGHDSSGNDRNGELDDLGVQGVEDAERGGVLELEGSTNGFIVAEVPDLRDGFTIMMWAYRDSLLCCGGGGNNDGLFQVQLGDGDPADLLTPSTSTKVIGGWVQKPDAAVWGRVITADGANNLDNTVYFMEDDEWVNFAYRGTGEEFEVVVNGESGVGPILDYDGSTLAEHDTIYIGRQGTETWGGRLDDFRVYSRALTDEEILKVMAGDEGGTALQAGDADMNLEFNQLDLVKVQIAAKYLTGSPATWGEGDWDGAPGGEPGNPPTGDGLFNQLDIIAALSAGTYLTGPYGAISSGGEEGDAQTSVGYNNETGEVWVDAPAGTDLTSINIDSAAAIFTGDAAQNLGGSFDNDADNNIFKATFGGSFGSLTFGTVAQPGLSEEFVAGDLTVVGSLAGGGDLGPVDLIYVPEPSSFLLLVLGALALVGRVFRWTRDG